MIKQELTRRSFLKGAAATGAAFASAGLLSACGMAKKTEQPIGIQLYTLRDQVAENMPQVLARLGSLGYREVEFAGYFDNSLSDIKGWLLDSGLTAPSAHVGHEQFKTDFERAVEASATMGHKTLFLSWLPPEDRTIQRYYEIAELLNRNGEIAKKAGIQLGFHNHEFEFEKQEGLCGYDIFLNNTDPKLVHFELDLYWTRVAGIDPLPLVKRFPGRFPCVHVKDYGDDGSIVDVGDGNIDFAALYGPLKEAGTRHFFIERDNSPEPFVTAERSIKAFSRAIGA